MKKIKNKPTAILKLSTGKVIELTGDTGLVIHVEKETLCIQKVLPSGDVDEYTDIRIPLTQGLEEIITLVSLENCWVE